MKSLYEEFKEKDALRKVPITITIDEDIRDFIRKIDMNVSRLINRLLRDVLKKEMEKK